MKHEQQEPGRLATNRQPVIIVIAYFVVQWDAGIPVKLPVVVLGSLVVSVGLYELIIRRVDPLRVVFGMKSRHLDRPLVGLR